MNQRLVEWIRGATGAAFTAGILLIALGVAGQSASPPLAIVVLAIGAVSITGRSRLGALLDNPAFAAYLVAVPVGPLLTGGIMLLFLGATPGELQTLGGVVGLLAIVNHLLRPLYALLAHLLTRVASVLA